MKEQFFKAIVCKILLLATCEKVKGDGGIKV